jgi:hypothetical protein
MAVSVLRRHPASAAVAGRVVHHRAEQRQACLLVCIRGHVKQPCWPDVV